MKTSPAPYVFGVLLVAYVLLVAGQRLYPFVDLPFHLAEAVIFKLSETPVFSKFYAVREGIDPNSFHYLFCSLFENVETGNRYYYMVYAAVLPLVTCLVIFQQGGNWKFSFLSFLFIFNYNVTFGFAGFTLAIPFVLLTFYLLCSKRNWAEIALVLVLIALFYIHVLALLFSLFLTVAIRIVQAENISGFFKRIWVVIPVLILFFIWQTHAFGNEESTLAFLMDYYLNSYWQEFYLRSKIFIYDNFVLAEGLPGILFALLVCFTVFLPIAINFSKYRFSISRIFAFAKQHKESMVFVGVCVICCFFLPNELPGQGILYQRFSVLLFLSIIIAGSLLYKDSIAKFWQVGALLVVLMHGALWYNYLSAFNRENESFNPSLFKKIPEGAPMGSVIIDYKYNGRPVYIHFSNYHIVWSQGIATTKVIDYRFGSIKRIASKETLPEYQEWSGTAGLIPEEYKNLKYLLIKGNPANFPEEAVQLAGDRNWKIVKMN